jgi:hypothetical protein
MVSKTRIGTIDSRRALVQEDQDLSKGIRKVERATGLDLRNDMQVSEMSTEQAYPRNNITLYTTEPMKTESEAA